MRPISICICGFGPYHEEGRVHFDADSICVTGDNGSGKTFIVEAVYAALYGRFPSRGGALANHLTEGRTKDASIVLKFDHGGETYQAHREVKASGKASAMLYRGNKVVAGPKVRDVDAAVIALIGPSQIAEATWFSGRGRGGDFCNVQAAQRREVLGELLQLQRLTDMAAGWTKQAIDHEAEAKVLTAQLATAGDAQGVEDAEIAVMAASDAADKIVAELEAEKDIQLKLACDKEDIESAIATHEASAEKLAEAQRAVRAANDDCEKIRGELSEARVKADCIEHLEQAIASAKEAEASIAIMERKREAAALYTNWRTNDRVLKQSIEVREERIAEIEKSAEVDDDTKATAAGLAAASAEVSRIRQENIAIGERNNATRLKRGDIERAIAADERHLTDLKKRLGAKPETPADDDVCATCPLMQEWSSLPDEIVRVSKLIEGRKARLAGLPDPEQHIDDAEAVAALEAARSAKAKVDAAGRQLEFLAKAQQSLAEAKERYEEHKTKEPTPTEWHDAEDVMLKQLRVEAAKLSGYEVELASAREALAEIDVIVRRFDAAKRALGAANGLLSEAEKINGDSDVKLIGLRKTLELTVGAIMLSKDRAAKIEARLSEANRELGRAESRLAAAQEHEEATAKKRESLAEAELSGKAKRLLARAFGVKGVQPLIIDNALPDLEMLCDELLDRMTGGQWRLRIETQALNQDGSTREDLRLEVQTAMGSRDISTFSGGELQIVQCVLRIAICRWIAQLHGHRPECLFIDEAFSDLDDENEARLVALIKELPEWVGQVVVVTPKPSVAALFPNRVTVSKSHAGVTLEVGL